MLFFFQLTHCSLQSLLCDLGQTFQLSPPGVSTRVTTREHPAAVGGTVGEKCQKILPKCRIIRYIQGSFTCRKATIWDRRLYYPSEGRQRAEDFFALKIRRLRPGYQRPARYLQTTEAALNYALDCSLLFHPPPGFCSHSAVYEVPVLGIFYYLTLRRLMSYIYMEHPFLMFLDHTQRRSTVDRTPLDE